MPKIETRLACPAGHLWSGNPESLCPECGALATKDVIHCPGPGNPHALWIARSLRGPMITCQQCQTRMNFSDVKRLIEAGRGERR